MLDVLLMETTGGLVEKEKRVRSLRASEGDRKAQTGAFAAGEVRRSLPEFQVVEASVYERFEFVRKGLSRS